MWQEYPSTSAEAFQRSTEGCYYSVQMTKARKEKRITTVPHTPGIPVNTYWDIASGDGTGIWFHQRVGLRNHFIKYMEGWGESYSHFVSEMQKTGWVWGHHYLPHDGNHVRQAFLIGGNSLSTGRSGLDHLVSDLIHHHADLPGDDRGVVDDHNP